MSSPSEFLWLCLSATSRKGGAWKWLNIVYVPLGIFAVILTASRSGFIATCIGLLSVFFALRHARPVYRLVWSAVIIGRVCRLVLWLAGRQ